MTPDPGDLSHEGGMGMAPGAGLESRPLKKCHLLVEGVDEQRKYCLPMQTMGKTGAAPEKGRLGVKWLHLLPLHSVAFTPRHMVEENTHPPWWCCPPPPPTHKDKTTIQDSPGFERAQTN